MTQSTIETKLLLDHIVSTFNVKLATLWIAKTDSFFTATEKGGHNIINTKSLVSFLAGYYYRYMRAGSNKSPIFIENVHKVADIPENLIKLAEIENITCILIIPVLHRKYVKGILVLGSDRELVFQDIDSNLLKLLTNVALHLNNNENTPNSATANPREEDQNSFGLI
ncbi:MAG: hypothetical protein GWN00_23800, partial [Aliifodinibius sp.]|nr:GAF domain-containing protein [Fodinibius sp.]NIY27717.1 hypothetical protein [Fodinibius sp.]